VVFKEGLRPKPEFLTRVKYIGRLRLAIGNTEMHMQAKAKAGPIGAATIRPMCGRLRQLSAR
jgi:hypothetical protein